MRYYLYFIISNHDLDVDYAHLNYPEGQDQGRVNVLINCFRSIMISITLFLVLTLLLSCY